jgi:capsular polysaccharide biosynthesis protein
MARCVVPAAPYDFTRFASSRHRYLLRHFTEISARAIAGPGSSLLSSVNHLVCELTRSQLAGKLMTPVLAALPRPHHRAAFAFDRPPPATSSAVAPRASWNLPSSSTITGRSAGRRRALGVIVALAGLTGNDLSSLDGSFTSCSLRMSTERGLREYLQILRRHWPIVISIPVVCVAAGAAIAWTRTPAYTASTQLFVSASAPSGNPAQSYDGGLFAQQRVLSYISIVSSPSVVQDALSSLGYHDSVPQVQREISASVPTGTVLLNVSVTDHSALSAKAIADAVSVAFIRFVERLETPRAGQPSYVKVNVITPALLPTAPSSPRKPLYLALGALLGLVLGIAAAVLLDSLSGHAVASRDLTGREHTADGVDQAAGSTVADRGPAEYRHGTPTGQTVRDECTEPAPVADTSRYHDDESARLAAAASQNATEPDLLAPDEDLSRSAPRDNETASTRQPAAGTRTERST